MPNPEMLNVGDLKQWAYCPRVVFYHRMMPGAGVATAKMQMGSRAQEFIEELEARRSMARYGLGSGERVFSPWLASERLGLQGRPDLVIVGADQVGVVDFKLTAEGLSPNLKMQVGAYSLLAEEHWGLGARNGFIYRISDGEVLSFAVDEAMRGEIHRAMDGIRKMIGSEELPPPTEVRARCTDCEYANYCGDVW